MLDHVHEVPTFMRRINHYFFSGIVAEEFHFLAKYSDRHLSKIRGLMRTMLNKECVTKLQPALSFEP